MQNKLLFIRAIALTIAVAPFGNLLADEEKSAEEKTPPAVTETKNDTAPEMAPEPDDPNLPPLLANDKALKRELENARFEKSLIDARLALQEAKRKEAENDAALEKTKFDEEKAKIEREIAMENAKATQALTARSNQIRQLETEAKIFKLEMDNLIAQYGAELSKYQKEREASKVALNEPKWLDEPLVDGTLYISDRRVEFNGAVTDTMAQRIINEINFLNNQNDRYPIFIVIDNSPGGSVAAGFQILKAMESSKAPVYVVVKSFAASMAAVVATLAERSFCFNNTIILHHQMSSTFSGNMTALRENLQWSEIWYDRLATPVAAKMGLSLPEFTAEMYKHTKTGDWREFGDKAKELKWVDTVVTNIVETGIREIPAPAPSGGGIVIRTGENGTVSELSNCVEKVDEKGQHYIQLPALTNPCDVWWLYDNRGIYRAQ